MLDTFSLLKEHWVFLLTEKVTEMRLLLFFSLCVSDYEISEKQKTTPKKGVKQRKQSVEKAGKMPKHIKDITISRKTYAKWRLLNPATKTFTEQALEITML